MDVGGTFIDYVLLDETTGELTFEKQPSLPESLAGEVVRGLRRLPVAPSEIGRFFHGSTVAINAIVQERGARVGLITTEGFRDVLGIGRGGRPELYNFLYAPPSPLIPRYLRREVPERLAADGGEILPLDLEALDREVELLVAEGVESIAVCFLHAYANPAHERLAAERIRIRHPRLDVTASSDVATEWHEFERTSTAVLNAYIQPLFRRYLADLTDQLRAAGYGRPLALMQSNGGVISSERAIALPIRTLESGPAAGVIGAQALAHELGHANVICTDVGGTTFDVALIDNGEILERTQSEVARRPILGPTIDIISIGAGGGSIAWIDQRGTIQVGPRSAGASPGPACFGHGGTEPTVTDCHLVLGRLDPEHFLGARMRLDLDAARQAILTHIAQPLELTLEEAADGILAIAETNMIHAIRTITVERGLDPREFVVYAYGGGGGLFAAATAEELEIPTVVVPNAPANFSAWGVLASDYREDAALTRVRTLDTGTVARVRADLLALGDAATDGLHAYGFGDAVDRHYRADLRFAGQEHTITISLDPDWLADDGLLLKGCRERFVAAHRQLYGHGNGKTPLEIVTVRCRAVGRVVRPPWREWPRSAPAQPRELRPVYVRQAAGYISTPVFDRNDLARGQVVEGPAIIEEWNSTLIVPPAWQAAVDRLGNLIMNQSAERQDP
ncbi:MAG TPA: hydantoinase/oxoprolinase family protein [Chloroflexota bacterium]|nr:hydantoinase/oxoprolinase family protein [Chloroflexota bacterium]HZS91178.1 hydantoinase/oxoprolinase family protein [Chloroflexota bacterium]